MKNPSLKKNPSKTSFGMIMSERSFSSENYKYGFNSQEKDDEVAGSGNFNTAEYWEYDTRLGKRWNIDPAYAKHTSESPYLTFHNNPMFFTDPFGDDPPETFEKHNGRGGDLYLPKSATLVTSTTTSSDVNGIETTTTNIDGFTIGDKTFNARYGSDGKFIGYAHIDGANTMKYTNPDITVKNDGVYGAQVFATFNVLNVPASGLQIVQTMLATERVDNGSLFGVYRKMEAGKSFCGAVDGGINSLWVYYGGEEFIPGMPYYGSTSSNWDPSTNSGSISFFDEPNAQDKRMVVRFETILVATNYMGSGKDVILGTYTWGWNALGKEPTHKSVQLHGTPSTTSYEIINKDYGEYNFFGQ